MTHQAIVDLCKERFAGRVEATYVLDKHPRMELSADNWRLVAEFLHHDARLQLDWLANLGGIDYAADEKMCVEYDLYSFELKHTFAVKVYCPRDNPTVPSVADLWPAADWHEREAFDLLGITFSGHPDLRRILLADDWVGFPLRKDYVFPREYDGIPASVELDWQQKPDYPQ